MAADLVISILGNVILPGCASTPFFVSSFEWLDGNPL